MESSVEVADIFRFFGEPYRQVYGAQMPLRQWRAMRAIEVEYLGRYTHRVAISNERILKLEGDQVTFCYRDSADGNRTKQMTLSAFEFIRRFLLHILPEGFVKIRHYGILSNRNRNTKLRRAQQILGGERLREDVPDAPLSWQDLLHHLTGIDPAICPYCGKGQMRTRQILPPQTNRSPP